MRNRNEAPAAILANVEVFDYLKEKVGERKTRTEAYCDLLDKSLAGFVSPFLRRQDYDLSPCQCHVTVSDLASEWHWHRATVRSFLDTLEALGQLERIRLAKSVVITMPLRTGTPAMPDSGREEADFATRIQEALYDWIIGKATSFDVGKSCGQIMRQTLTEIAGRVVSIRTVIPTRHRHRPSGRKNSCVRPSWNVLPMPPSGGFCVNRGSTTARRSCSSSGSTSAGNGRRSSRPRKSLQSLLSTENRTGQASVRTKRRNALNRFANPFYRFWRRRRRKAERGFADRDCITTGNSPQFRFKYPSSYSRHPGLPVCH